MEGKTNKSNLPSLSWCVHCGDSEAPQEDRQVELMEVALQPGSAHVSNHHLYFPSVLSLLITFIYFLLNTFVERLKIALKN